MIAGWVAYCIAVSVLLGVGAHAADAILTRRGRPATWVWAVALATSFVVPVAALVLQQRPPAPLPRAAESATQGTIARALGIGGDSVSATRERNVAAQLRRTPEFAGADRWAVAVLVVCVVLAGLRVVVDSVLLYRRRRAWKRAVVDGVPVWLSDDIGPAIVGLIEPIIVLPRWTEALAPDDRALMLAHERAHLRTNDGRLTTAALLAMMTMPWNPVAWWALRRLRTAIEVDCDRRVLREYPDISRYGRLLVDVAQRASGSSFAIAGFSERAAPLARRIQAMTAATRPARALDALTASVGACALIGAVTVLPPAAPARSLPQFARSVHTLPKNVGDSIAEGESPPTVVAAARNLPPAFLVVEYGPSNHDQPLVARCAQRLRDDRDSTRLVLSMSTTSTSMVVQHADTAWTRVESLGYYDVVPVGRYGVAKDQTLRVGCGGHTRISVGGRDLDLTQTATLDSPGDDRARVIRARVATDLHVTLSAIEVRPGRLNVVIADPAALALDDAETVFARRTLEIAHDLLGESAAPETLAVSRRLGKARWSTMYHYWSMIK